MGTSFWVRRFLLVFGIAFTIIAAAQLVQGESLDYAATQALLWAAISASIFTGSRIYQSRKGKHCAICNDTPEMQQSSHEGREA
ncbi:hypothetical protein [Lysobacter sp. D1-1-M9]|uniref:hypothetical protein n=1 Tax=Novilysobacter longmucuonensis TaxID=3098603 RepID=UPI002FC6D467